MSANTHYCLDCGVVVDRTSAIARRTPDRCPEHRRARDLAQKRDAKRTRRPVPICVLCQRPVPPTRSGRGRRFYCDPCAAIIGVRP